MNHERLVQAIGNGDKDHGEALSDEDEQRLEEAERTIHTTETDDALERLAALQPLEYERIRKGEAKKLGVRAQALDREVYQRRQKAEQQADTSPRGGG